MSTDVIDVENVRNVVSMMQNVETQLHQKYDEQKDGMHRSIKIQNSQADLSSHLKAASNIIYQRKEAEKMKQKSPKNYTIENARKIRAINREF